MKSRWIMIDMSKLGPSKQEIKEMRKRRAAWEAHYANWNGSIRRRDRIIHRKVLTKEDPVKKLK